MTSNKNDNEILGISQKNIRQDILLFKEEVLKDIKVVQKDFSNKFEKMEDLVKEQISIYESKVNSFEHRINNLSNLISADRSITQKVEDFEKFKEETKEKLLTESIRLSNLETDFKVNIKNIEKILSSSVIYPGLIGYNGKYKSFHDFMDYMIDNISDLRAFKERSNHDLIPYKKKVDDTLEYIKIQVNHIINSSNEFTIKKINDSEQRMKSLIQLYDDRLQDTRVENAHYSVGLEKRSEELSRLINNVYEIKADINKKLKDEFSNFKGEQKTLLRLFTAYKKEFGQIKNKFIQLSEFIRDVRFRVNIGPDSKKKDFIEMSKKLNTTGSNFSHKRSTLINRADTFDLNKKELNNNFGMFDSPFNHTFNRYNSNTFKYSKRNSLQLGNLQKFSNKVINKFEINQKAEPKKKNPSDYSPNKLTNNITSINSYENAGFENNDKSQKKPKFERRNTAALPLSGKFHKYFSDFNQKNLKFNIMSNNEILETKKEKEENSLYNSISNSEDSSFSNIKDKERISLENKNKNKKSEFIIKEEDENNISSITDDFKKKKSIRENKSKEKNNKQNIINMKASQGFNINNSGEKIIQNEEKNQKEKKEEKDTGEKDDKKDKDEKNKKEEEKNENVKKEDKEEKNKKEEEKNENSKKEENNEKQIEKNYDTKIKKINSEGNNNIIQYINNNNIAKKKIYSGRLEKRNEKVMKMQVNKNELKEVNKKPERNNTISIISLNDMFMNNKNKVNKHTQFINSSKNFLYGLSVENSYLRQNQITGIDQSFKTKSNPSLLSKPNKIRINSSSFHNIDKISPNNNIATCRIIDSVDIDNMNNFEKSGQPYKTYSVFPKLGLVGLDKNEGRPFLNSKIVFLNNNNKMKKISEIANNFLNKKINKTSINKGPIISKIQI